MPDTTVTYHRDGYGPGRPAVNVKVHGYGAAFWPKGWEDRPDGWALSSAEQARHASDLIGAAQETVYARFWQQAADKAADLGLGPIAQGGRSGGWLVLTDGRDPAEPETMTSRLAYVGFEQATREWLAAYRQLAEWCAEQVRTAPARVAALAQQLAMDELGAEPATRMFATFPGCRYNGRTVPA